MSTLSFTKAAAQALAAAYATPDMQAQRETVLNALNLQSGESVIDVGCGPGFLCEAMAEQTGRAGTVLGIDISADLIRICRERDPPEHLTYAVGDALKLSQRDNSFDVAVCTQVAEYIADTETILSEIFRVLKPGGRVLVMATDWDCVGWNTQHPDRMKRIMKTWEGHCAHPTLPRKLGLFLQGAGFKDLEVTSHPLINIGFEKSNYSFAIAKMICQYVKKADPSQTEEADDWFGELVRLDTADSYYFSSSRMIFCAQKPAGK